MGEGQDTGAASGINNISETEREEKKLQNCFERWRF